MLQTEPAFDAGEGVLQQDEILRAVAIEKSFGAKRVLAGVNLTARVGDVIAVVGASGSGKSTFLRCLNFLEKPSAGRVLFGADTFDADPGSADYWARRPGRLVRLRQSVGMVFQSFNLWPHRTAIENVIEGPTQVLGMPRRQALEQARSLMVRVGLGDRCEHYPNQLSGGQQQRIAIARALAMNPTVLLFDEPTSALDPELVNEVLKVIKDLAGEGRTMIIVTHEMSFARDVASKAIFMASGHVEEEGAPADFFAKPQSQLLRSFLSRYHGEAGRHP